MPVPSQNTAVNCLYCRQKLLPAISSPTGTVLGWYPVNVSAAGITLDSFVGISGELCVFRGQLAGEAVAVKFLRPEHMQDAKMLRRFQAEIKIHCQKINHPNFPELVGSDGKGSIPYYATKWIDGDALSRIAAKCQRDKSGVPFKQGLHWFGQMCAAVKTLHDVGIIHGALTPASFRRDRAEKIYLIDLGIVKVDMPTNDGATKTSIDVGTLDYLAPEQMSQSNAFDHRADIYALGVIMNELLTCRRSSVNADMTSRNPTVPSWFSDLLIHMTKPAAVDRPANIGEILRYIDSQVQIDAGQYSEQAPRSQALPVNAEPPIDTPVTNSTGPIPGNGDNANQSGNQSSAVKRPSIINQIKSYAIGIGIICAITMGVDYLFSPSGPGKRLEFGKGEVFYTGGVEQHEASKIGDLLVRAKYFTDQPASVQIRLQNRRYEARFIIRPVAENDTPTRPWRELADLISRECLRSSPVDIHLCDRSFNTLKVIPFQPVKPELPIEVTFRPSIGRGSLVAQYRNRSDKYLALSVKITNTTVGQSNRITVSLGPNQMYEHGWVEGWSYASGEKIEISHADYEPMELRVP